MIIDGDENILVLQLNEKNIIKYIFKRKKKKQLLK